MKFLVLALALAAAPAVAFTASTRAAFGVRTGLRVAPRATHMSSDGLGVDRRSILALPVKGAAAVAAVTVLGWPAGPANAATAAKVVVVGGAGWVGSYIDQELASQGASVVSVSRSSPSDQEYKVKANTGSVPKGLTFVQADAASDDLVKIFKGCDAVINCCGVAPGGENMLDGNGAVNVRVADAAKAAGVPRFVYIGVASDMGVTGGPAKIALADYFKGKAIAEEATSADYPSSLILKPAAVAGAPKGESRPPSPPGAAPISPLSLAKVAVAGAFGLQSGVIDGAGAIQRAAVKADLASASYTPYLAVQGSVKPIVKDPKFTEKRGGGDYNSGR